MRTTYKRELERNYLILEQENFQNSYQIGMLVKNQIPGLLKCRLSLVDRRAAFYYEITSRQNLRLVLDRKRLTAEELETLLEGLLQTAESCEEYLLDTRGLLLNPDYIYLDPDVWECSFCLFPFYEGDLRDGLFDLAEYLLDRLDKEDPGAVALGYEFYRMAGEEHGSLKQVLDKWREAKPREGTREEAAEKAAVPGERREVCAKGAQEESAEPGRTGETVCLKRSFGLVLRSENSAYSSMEIIRDPFLIGKKKDAVDGWIKARGISRIHGKITREEGGYYLTDLNSTNGTFLNGGRLEVNEKARIRQGDLVGFADAKYIVELPGEGNGNQSRKGDGNV